MEFERSHSQALCSLVDPGQPLLVRLVPLLGLSERSQRKRKSVGPCVRILRRKRETRVAGTKNSRGFARVVSDKTLSIYLSPGFPLHPYLEGLLDAPLQVLQNHLSSPTSPVFAALSFPPKSSLASRAADARTAPLPKCKASSRAPATVLLRTSSSPHTTISPLLKKPQHKLLNECKLERALSQSERGARSRRGGLA